jgi:hypothetical protein
MKNRKKVSAAKSPAAVLPLAKSPAAKQPAVPPLAKLPFMFAAIMVAGLLASLSVSCASTGNFMPISQGETVIGTVQADFVARNTLKGRDAINIQAYIKLLEAAQSRYGRAAGQETAIDIRDIVWVSGQAADNLNTEYSATGKVVQIP